MFWCRAQKLVKLAIDRTYPRITPEEGLPLHSGRFYRRSGRCNGGLLTLASALGKRLSFRLRLCSYKEGKHVSIKSHATISGLDNSRPYLAVESRA